MKAVALGLIRYRVLNWLTTSVRVVLDRETRPLTVIMLWRGSEGGGGGKMVGAILATRP